MNDDYMEAIHKHTNELVAKYMLELDGLTQQQLADAIAQAIKSGDFIRYVHVRGGLNHAQAVTYIPYERAGRQERRILDLEEKITKLSDKLNEMRNVLGDED